MLTFEVPGKIKGKQRPRFGKGKVYTQNQTVTYENWIRACFIDAKHRNNLKVNMEIVPLRIKIVCTLSIPQSYTKKKKLLIQEKKLLPTKTPDIDNVIKVVCDALNGVAYSDDRQIVECYCVKQYGEAEGLRIDIMEV